MSSAACRYRSAAAWTAGQPFARAAGRLALTAQFWALRALGGGLPPGRIQLGGQRGRGVPGGRACFVLGGGLLGGGPQRFQPAERGDVLLAAGPQLGCGDLWVLRVLWVLWGYGGPGSCLGVAGLGQRGGGPVGLGQGGGDLGGPDGGVKFPAERLGTGGGQGELIPGSQRVGAAALPVRQPFGLALAVLGLVQLAAVGADLSGTGG